MSGKCNCGCNNLKLIYSCSGAANTGYLADRIARELGKEENYGMTCLSGMGADLSGFIESAKCAKTNIMLDGCKIACGSKILAKNNILFQHYIMTDFNIEKGKTEITDEVVKNVKMQIKEKIKD